MILVQLARSCYVVPLQLYRSALNFCQLALIGPGPAL